MDKQIMAQTAKAAADFGLAPFPTQDKRPALKGDLKAQISTDPAVYAPLFRSAPNANGVAVFGQGLVICVDDDSAYAGGLPLPPEYESPVRETSIRKGIHHYWKHPGVDLLGNLPDPYKGEIKTTAQFNLYGPLPWDKLEDMPSDLLNLLRKKTPAELAKEAELAAFQEMDSYWFKGNQLTPQPVDWLLDGLIAYDHLTMISAEPGVGKTMYYLSLSSRITQSNPLLPPQYLGRQVNARTGRVWVFTENTRQQIGARLNVTGDLSKVDFINTALLQGQALLDYILYLLVNTAELPDMLVVDSFLFWMDIENWNDMGAKGPVPHLRELKRFAKEYGTAIVPVSHHRKDSKTSRGSEISGTTGIRAMIDTNLSLTTTPANPKLIQVESTTKLDTTPETFSFTITDTGLTTANNRKVGRPGGSKVPGNILNELTANGQAMTLEEIADALEITVKTARTHALSLVADGELVRFPGPGNANLYGLPAFAPEPEPEPDMDNLNW